MAKASAILGLQVYRAGYGLHLSKLRCILGLGVG